MLRDRFDESPSAAFDALNRSLPIDRALWREDLDGSRAHVRMLAGEGILTMDEAARVGDIFVTAAANMGCEPSSSIVVEDATSGVKAGQNGGFGLVIGLARENNEEDLKSNGADNVIKDFEGISIEDINVWFKTKNN